MTFPPVMMFCCSSARTALEEQGPLPSDVGLIELPCSGRIDQALLIKVLRQGAWTVAVVGCLEGNCKYHSGNYQARRRVEEVRSVLTQLRLDPQRVQMFNIASNHQAKLRGAIKEMRERAEMLGPIRPQEVDK